MYARQVMVTNATGLHARPASDFVRLAGTFKSRIQIRRAAEPESKAVNAKAIIQILAFGCGQGTEVVIAAEGEDEREAVDALAALIESRFGEGE